jgi:hypothetical protein
MKRSDPNVLIQDIVILKACESFGRRLHTYLTLRNGAKRSVSKGGNTHGADAPHDRGSSVLRVAILRDAPLRYAPQDEVEK